MTVYTIIHTERGSEEAGLISVHASLEGAKAAIVQWARDRWDERTDQYLAKYLSDSGYGLYTEDHTLEIVERSVLP